MSITAKRHTKDILPLPGDQEVTPTHSNRIPFDKEAYDASCMQYEAATDHNLLGSDTIIVGGYGASIKVERSALILRSEQATAKKKIMRLYCGDHTIRQIIILSDGGYITIDAIQWCVDQDITVVLLDWKGYLIQVLTPRHPFYARLIYQQYVSCQSNLGIEIAREIVHRKTVAQITTLKNLQEERWEVLSGDDDLPFLNHNRVKKQPASSPWKPLEDGLDKLSRLKDVVAIRMLECSLAHIYWNTFTGYPISWDEKVAKSVPTHWQSITGRKSILSRRDGRNAVNPFHAALNFAYALLEAQVLISITAMGLDPTCGYLHANQKGCTNVLVYDLMEPFRADVDAKVFAFFGKTTFKKGDFYQVINGECRVNEELRRFIIATCRIPQDNISGIVNWLVKTLKKQS